MPLQAACIVMVYTVRLAVYLYRQDQVYIVSDFPHPKSVVRCNQTAL